MSRSFWRAYIINNERLPEYNRRTYHLVKENNDGKIATYIPELAKVNPKKFGVCLTTKEGKQFTYGDFDEAFSIQSVAKVLSLSFAFNSLSLLEVENGIPRPFNKFRSHSRL